MGVRGGTTVAVEGLDYLEPLNHQLPRNVGCAGVVGFDVHVHCQVVLDAPLLRMSSIAYAVPGVGVKLNVAVFAGSVITACATVAPVGPTM
jgi:hypothetical protein